MQQSRVVLQIVPTISDISMSNGGGYVSGQLTVTGTGFAEGALAVWFGDQRLEDPFTSSIDVYSSNKSFTLSMPDHVSSGPIRITTAGGTSAVFGVSLTGITTQSSSGVASSNAQASAQPGQVITLTGTAFDLSTDVVFQTIDSSGTRDDIIVKPKTVSVDRTSMEVVVPYTAITGKVRVVGDTLANEIPLQIIPMVTDVEVSSVSSDGSSAIVILHGLGFIEGNATEYRFGDTVVTDTAINDTILNLAGADVQDDYRGGVTIYNGRVYVTVPLSAGSFGPVSVKTAGGTSALYTVSLDSIDSVALSGTPANAALASANPGQAVTLRGQGLTASTDILLSYTNVDGNLQMRLLNPSVASADGTSATLVIPTYANGANALQVLGSTSRPVLQIVPVVNRAGSQPGNNWAFEGYGFVEAGIRVDLSGGSVTDASTDDNADVYYSFHDGASQENGRLTLKGSNVLVHYGVGVVTVTTAGGTSGALTLNQVLPGTATTRTGTLYDVAFASDGTMWVSGAGGNIQRVDTATGLVQQTLALGVYANVTTGNYLGEVSGLQVLPQGITLAGVAVPAGSLLVFNTNSLVRALNPVTGAVLASLSLGTNLNLTAGLYDVQSGHLLTLSAGLQRLLESNATTGAEIARFSLPAGVSNMNSYAGLAVDPVTGNLWVGTYDSRSTLVEMTRGGVEVRRVDGATSNESSGLSFAADGSLWVASYNGYVTKLSLAAL